MQDHALRHRSMTGSHQSIGSFEFDHANAAGPARDEITMMAKRGNLDSGLFRGLQNCHSLERLDSLIVDSDF